jgi:hypothetical protein
MVSRLWCLLRWFRYEFGGGCYWCRRRLLALFFTMLALLLLLLFSGLRHEFGESGAELGIVGNVTVGVGGGRYERTRSSNPRLGPFPLIENADQFCGGPGLYGVDVGVVKGDKGAVSVFQSFVRPGGVESLLLTQFL